MAATGEALPVLIPLGGLATDVIAQLVVARLRMRAGHVRRQFGCFAAGGVAVVLAEILLRPARGAGAVEELAGLSLAAASYSFLGFLFFNALNANLSSLRIRLLKELLAREPAGLPAATLLREYGAGEILRARIERLAAGGQLVERDGRLYFRPRGVAFIGKLFAGLRVLLLRSAP